MIGLSTAAPGHPHHLVPDTNYNYGRLLEHVGALGLGGGAFISDLYDGVLTPAERVFNYPNKSTLQFPQCNKFELPNSSSNASGVHKDNKFPRSPSHHEHRQQGRSSPIRITTYNRDQLHQYQTASSSLNDSTVPMSSCYLGESYECDVMSGSSRGSNQSHVNVATTRTYPCLTSLPSKQAETAKTSSNIFEFTQSALPATCHRRRYKTEMCRRYLNNPNNYCDYGDKCQYAHGVNELRMPSRHLKYKTELCKPFHSTGICPYGRRCDFIHNENKKKLVEIRSLLQMFHQFRSVYPNVEDVSICRMKEMMDRALASDPVGIVSNNKSATTSTTSPLTSLLSGSSNTATTPISGNGETK